MLLPHRRFKGYGLSLVIGLLAGTLNHAAMGRDVVDFNNDDPTDTNTGHTIVAINIEAFQDLPEFKQGMDTLIRDIRNSQRLPGVDRIRLPGEQSQTKRIERMRSGIPLPPPLLKSLNGLANELGIDPVA